MLQACSNWLPARLLGLETLAEPVGEIGLADTAAGNILHHPDGVHRIKVEALAVVCQGTAAL